jgi:hypothetical protein
MTSATMITAIMVLSIRLAILERKLHSKKDNTATSA